MNDDEITYWLELCENISQEVEEAIKIAREDPTLNVITKIGADGTPTHKIDEYAENAAIRVLEDSGISLILISEEIGTIKIGENPARIVMILDPLDGTTNALKNLPCYGISIAIGTLSNHDNLENTTLEDIEIAYVKNFPTNDVYTAVKNKYSTKNNKLIKVSDVNTAKHATVSSYIHRSKRDMNRIFPNVRRMRIMGSIAVEMCYLADGIYDVFLDTHAARVLDIAAAQLIIKEAGGYITDIDSNVLSSQIDLMTKTTIVATSTKQLQEDILNLLN